MKYAGLTVQPPGIASPPSRGAWIEILDKAEYLRQGPVAPLAGGVD